MKNGTLPTGDAIDAVALEKLLADHAGGLPDAKGSGVVNGIAFDDANGNMVLDKGEQAKSGWTVFLDANKNGRQDLGEASTTTDKTGHYTFENVAAGKYNVVMEAPFGWQHWSFGQAGGAPAQHNPMDDMAPIDRIKAAVAASQLSMAEAGHHYQAGDFSAEHVAGKLVVKLAGLGLNPAQTEQLMHSVGATVDKSTVALGTQLWSIHGMSIEDAAAKLLASGKVAYANPDYILHVDSVSDAQGGHAVPDGHSTGVTPNDPSYNLDYGMPQIDAPSAWEYGTGSHSVVVGDIDTGADLQHPDLVNNFWTNPGEIAGNGIDDDGNGYVDDVHGYDFIHGDGDPDDGYGHGTHTAGTIGAQGDNGVGVAGVNWNVSIMPLQIFDENGQTDSFSATLAVEYATMMGVKVTNNSWGGGGYDSGLYDAIAAAGAAGDLFIAAAGNNHSNNDVNPFYPATYNLDNIISVAALDAGRFLAAYSDYGARTVDLAAPGTQVYSTLPIEQGSYGYESGTSMATPHVTGAIALIEALMPDLSLEQIKDALLNGVTSISSLQGKVLTGGELSIIGALNSLSEGAQSITVGKGATVTADFGGHSSATAGADSLQGYDLAEQINGLAGNDTIKGGTGADTLIGDKGNDKLFGQGGADIFYFAKGSGADKILDFSHGDGDKIQINVAGVSGFGDLTIASDGHGGSLVSFGTASVDVAKVAPGQLGATDFSFGSLGVAPNLEASIAQAHFIHTELLHLHQALA